MMRIACIHLVKVDIPLYFALAANMVSVNDILTTQNHPKKITNNINFDKYNKYKEKMDKKYGHGRYIHDFLSFWRRTLISPTNGEKRVDILPFTVGSIELIKYWAKYELNLSKKYCNKIASLRELPMSCSVQFQGFIESHYRTWCNYVYVYL